MTDFIQHLAELAGDDIANKIITEFGGQLIYVRKSITRSPMVRCWECMHCVTEEVQPHYAANNHCGLTKLYTSVAHWRICKDFSAANKETPMPTPSPFRIDAWRLREILRLNLYRTTSVKSSVGGGWFMQRRSS